MKAYLCIAISGKSGCGNTSVSKLVADRLRLRMINYTFRSIADERGIPFERLRDMAEADDCWDRYLDRRQVEMAAEGDCVLGSRLAIWLLANANLKVFLDAPVEERARRIQLDVTRHGEGGDFATVLRRTIERDRRDHDRYLRLYGIDNNDYAFADLVVDTSLYTKEEIADLIVREVQGGPMPRPNLTV